MSASESELRRRFEAHLAPLLGPAYGTALHWTRNAHDAEDLVQEAAYLAFRSFHQYEEGTRFKAWFYRILTNQFFQRHRRARREVDTVELDEGPILHLFVQAQRSGLAASEPDPADSILGKLSTEQVAAAIQELPEDFRMACGLYFMEDFNYQEIADVLDCPVGTVRSRLHRGRRHLQKALWRIAEELGIVPTAAPAPPENAS